MAQSQNTTVDLTIPATMFTGFSVTGSMMVGDRALEFYNERNVEDYIQIPWDQIDHVAASVMFRGRVIARWAVFTVGGANYSFSTRDNRAALRAVRDHIGGEKVLRSATFFGVIRAGLSGIWRRITRRG